MNRKHPLLLALSAAMVMGTSAPAFAAEATDAATREDVISLLWQQEGAPVINYALPFTDVADTAADAVRWAAEAKIVSGYGNGKFEPNQKITREQLAAIFYRYAAYKGYDVSVGENTNILSFADASDITPYAIPAIQWAYGSGVFLGTEEYVLPSAAVAEAEVTTMLKKVTVPPAATVVAEIPEESISLVYKGNENFVLTSKDVQEQFQLNCLVDGSYAPTLTLADLNNDGKDEIYVIFTVGAVSADYGGIYLLLDKGAFPFHGLCADSVDLGSVLSFAESAAEVAVYFSRGAAFYILLDAVFRIFLVLCRPHGELFCDLRLYRGNHRLPYLAEPFADGTASGGSV